MNLKVLLMLCAFFGSSAFACPDLKGTYDCASTAVVIDQTVENGTTIYAINDQAMPAVAAGAPTHPLVVPARKHEEPNPSLSVNKWIRYRSRPNRTVE